jgi:hypothetical protein
MTTRKYIVHPEGFLLAGFCFVMLKMVGSLGDYFIYIGVVNQSFVGVLGVFILLCLIGILYNTIEVREHQQQGGVSE